MNAECIYPAFDNQTATSYSPGVVADFDETNEKLNSLTAPSGNWIFQYPGHEGGPKKPVKTVEAKIEEVAKPASKLKGRPMSAEHKAKMAEGRARKKAQAA